MFALSATRLRDQEALPLFFLKGRLTFQRRAQTFRCQELQRDMDVRHSASLNEALLKEEQADAFAAKKARVKKTGRPAPISERIPGN
ncbi:hypothetical protein [Klebsiella pneumoniae]|uniref:hypothetical protein n=1 Tax=Klebsiella pneumoniae TaxID=573 RepID=UPI002270B40F|nr:hypothetical protein [Klebsiella pneumoniae]MCY0160099.1 hypothetical protein [Klebsiella pneumoniae]